MDWMKILELAVQGITTMVAAFAGAKYALKLQDDKDKRRENSENQTKLKYALFQLDRIQYQFTDFRAQFIEKWRSADQRHFLIKPVMGELFAHQKFDFTGLTFILESPEPSTLEKLSRLEDDCKAVIDSINERSSMHALEFQPIAEVMPMDETHIPTLEELTRAVGPRISQSLKAATDHLVLGTDRIIDVTGDVKGRMMRQLKHLQDQTVG